MLAFFILAFIIYWLFQFWFPKYQLHCRTIFGKTEYRILRRRFSDDVRLFTFEDVGESFKSLEAAENRLTEYIIYNL